MTTETKKAPGRPKATQPVAEATPKKKPVIRRKEQVNQNKEFEIPKNAGVVFLLPQKGVTVYDVDHDTVREIRYCPISQIGRAHV